MGLIGASKEGLSVWETAGRQVWYVIMKRGGGVGCHFGDVCRVIRKSCFWGEGGAVAGGVNQCYTTLNVSP